MLFFFLIKQILTIQTLLPQKVVLISGQKPIFISFWIILITVIFSNNQTFKGKLNGFNNLFVLENEKSTYQNTSTTAR